MTVMAGSKPPVTAQTMPRVMTTVGVAVVAAAARTICPDTTDEPPEGRGNPGEGNSLAGVVSFYSPS